jgi:hypothetical protein
MQHVWHCLVNLSFGYLGLLAVVRIAQELNALILPFRKAEDRPL